MDLAIQSSKTQHAKELESRDEDLAQQRTSMTKKLKALEQQLEEEHELKQQAIKVGVIKVGVIVKFAFAFPVTCFLWS